MKSQADYPLELLHQAIVVSTNGERLPAAVQDWLTFSMRTRDRSLHKSDPMYVPI